MVGSLTSTTIAYRQTLDATRQLDVAHEAFARYDLSPDDRAAAVALLLKSEPQRRSVPQPQKVSSILQSLGCEDVARLPSETFHSFSTRTECSA